MTRRPKSHIGLCKATLAQPTMVGQPRKPVFNSPTPLFMYGNFNLKKTWVGWLCVAMYGVNLTLHRLWYLLSYTLFVKGLN